MRVQKALHEPLSFAHVTPPLTKDQTLVLGPRTCSSPAREMSRFKLARYLGYCAKMLALSAKLAALCAGESSAPVVIAEVNDTETLTSTSAVRSGGRSLYWAAGRDAGVLNS